MSLFEGYMQYRGMKSQARGAEKAADTAYYAGERAREDLRPWREAGGEALFSLSDLLGLTTEGRDPSEQFGALTKDYEFEQDPGYAFRLAEGEKAMGRGQAARGDFLSGRGMKELGRYGQQFASEEYGKGYERDLRKKRGLYDMLAGLSSGGRGAGAQMGQFGMSAAGDVGAAKYAKATGQGQFYQDIGGMARRDTETALKMLAMGGR